MRTETSKDAKAKADALFQAGAIDAMKKKGSQYPKSEDNPDGYDGSENARRLQDAERQGARGREDKDGIEAVPDYKTLKAAMADGMTRFRKIEADKVVYKEWAKGVAKRTNTHVQSINKLMKASFNGTVDKETKDFTRQLELYNEVGPVEKV